MQLESGRLVDFNVGLGKNNLQTASAGVRAAPASDRAFLSVGTSAVTPLTKNSYVQYKAALGYTYDGVDEYTQSDGTSSQQKRDPVNSGNGRRQLHAAP